VSFDVTNLCVASQRVFIVVVYFVVDSGKFWRHPRTYMLSHEKYTKLIK